jgi:hypothetical protein
MTFPYIRIEGKAGQRPIPPLGHHKSGEGAWYRKREPYRKSNERRIMPNTNSQSVILGIILRDHFQIHTQLCTVPIPCYPRA